MIIRLDNCVPVLNSAASLSTGRVSEQEMAFVLDSVAILNLVLSLAIVGFGAWVYLTKRETRLTQYVAAGFGLFAVSHAMTVLGYGSLEAVMLPLRAAGYLVMIAGLAFILLRAKGMPAVQVRRERERERQIPAR